MAHTTRTVHSCNLPPKDVSGLPRLPPNALWVKRCSRTVRKLFLLNTRHYMCKQLFRNSTSMLEERKRHATSRYSYVIHPLSSFSIFVEALFFFIWFYNIFCGSLTIWQDNFLLIQKLIVLPTQIILIMILFNMGYIDTKTKQVIIEPKKIVRKYLTTYFIFDVMSCYTLDWVSHILLDHYSLPMIPELRVIWFETMLIIRTLAACVRFNTLMRFFDNTLANMRCNKTVRVLLIYIFKTLVCVHVFSIFMFLIPHFIYKGKWPSKSWLYQAGISSSTSAKGFDIYLESIIMTVSYFFGISERCDITLLNEQVFLVIVSFCGRIYTLYLLADVLRVFGIAGVSESLYERNLFVLQKYMVMKNLPDHLRGRMLKFYEFKFQRRYFKEQEILNTLSDSLRTELFLFSARQLVHKVEILKKLPAATVGAIVASMKSETYSAKDYIIKIGWELNEIYFVSTGTVAVIDSYNCELCHLEDGELFGGSCLYQKEQPYTIMAVETTEVFIIDKNELIQFLLPYSDVLAKFHSLIKQRLLKLKNLSERLDIEKVDVYSKLLRGDILETRTKRLFSK